MCVPIMPRFRVRVTYRCCSISKGNRFCSSVYACVRPCCTLSLEVDASHLHRVCRVVGRNVRIVQQTFCAWLWLFPFATGKWDKHRVERGEDVQQKQQNNFEWATAENWGSESVHQIHKDFPSLIKRHVFFAEAGYFLSPVNAVKYG